MKIYSFLTVFFGTAIFGGLDINEDVKKLNNYTQHETYVFMWLVEQPNLELLLTRDYFIVGAESVLKQLISAQKEKSRNIRINTLYFRVDKTLENIANYDLEKGEELSLTDGITLVNALKAENN